MTQNRSEPKKTLYATARGAAVLWNAGARTRLGVVLVFGTPHAAIAPTRNSCAQSATGGKRMSRVARIKVVPDKEPNAEGEWMEVHGIIKVNRLGGSAHADLWDALERYAPEGYHVVAYESSPGNNAGLGKVTIDKAGFGTATGRYSPLEEHKDQSGWQP